MEDTPLSPDGCDAAREPEMAGPERNRGYLVREVRDRIEADRLDENSLQRYIIKRLRSTGTSHRTSRDRRQFSRYAFLLQPSVALDGNPARVLSEEVRFDYRL